MVVISSDSSMLAKMLFPKMSGLGELDSWGLQSHCTFYPVVMCHIYEAQAQADVHKDGVGNIFISLLPLNNSLLMREMTLKSRSGVMMAVTLPSILPIPSSSSMMKYSTDHS